MAETQPTIADLLNQIRDYALNKRSGAACDRILGLVERAMTIAASQEIQVNLIDVENSQRPQLPVRVVANRGTITLMPKGYGTANEPDGHGSPIYIELYEGRLRVLAWADITQEDPTHILGMEGARESRRPPDPGNAADTPEE